MENDDYTVDLEDTIPDEEVETIVEEETSETTESDIAAELAKERAKAAKFQRLYEKEKSGKTTVTKTVTTPNPSPSVDIDERILKANGMNDELMSQLKKVAQVEGVSLIDAQNSDLFVAVKEKYEKDQKAKQASLGASRGSGQPKPKVGFDTPGLTEEQHRAMYKSTL